MQEAVNFKGATIHVRDDVFKNVSAVCIRCKGFKSVYTTDYFDWSHPLPGGVFWIGHEIVCPVCGGRGLYYHKPSR